MMMQTCHSPPRSKRARPGAVGRYFVAEKKQTREASVLSALRALLLGQTNARAVPDLGVLASLQIVARSSPRAEKLALALHRRADLREAAFIESNGKGGDGRCAAARGRAAPRRSGAEEARRRRGTACCCDEKRGRDERQRDNSATCVGFGNTEHQNAARTSYWLVRGAASLCMRLV